MLVEVSGGVTLDTAPAYAAAGVDLISVGALTHSVAGARPRARPRGRGRRPRRRLSVLLAIDVGNTETVIGPLRADRGRGRVAAAERRRASGSGPSTSRAAASPTTGGCRRSPTRTPDEHAVLLTQLLDLEGLDIAASVTGIAISSSVPGGDRRAAPDGLAVVRRRALRRARTRGEERHAHPLRQPQGGRAPTGWPTPSAPTTSTAGPASSSTSARPRPSTPSRPTASTWAGPSPPGWPSASRPSSSTRRPCGGSSWCAPRDVIGRSTVESIQSGALYGFAAQVDGLCRRFVDELGPVDGGGHRRPVAS